MKIRRLFRYELEEQDRYFFMYHPQSPWIAYPIYWVLCILQAMKRIDIRLAYVSGDEHPVGLILLRNFNDHGAELGLAVSKRYRGKGLGRILMDEIFTMSKSHGLKELYLTFHPDNHAARRLYESYGFETCGKVVCRSIFIGAREEESMKTTL